MVHGPLEKYQRTLPDFIAELPAVNGFPDIEGNVLSRSVCFQQRETQGIRAALRDALRKQLLRQFSRRLYFFVVQIAR